jgi:alpha-tubulin suppressor-like RCC1 family protein
LFFQSFKRTDSKKIKSQFEKKPLPYIPECSIRSYPAFELMQKSFICLLVSFLLFANSCVQPIRKSAEIAATSKPTYQSIVSACGSNHTLMIRDSTLWAWGKNDRGQLGDGTLVNRTFPVLIDSTKNWVTVAVSNYHSLGLKTDGTIWAWGNNEWSELGDGTKTARTKPVQIGKDTDWKAIAAAESRSMALKADGSIWVWGSNLNLRNDRTLDILTTPTQLSTGKNWVSLTAGPEQTFALASDGTLWAWGDNHRGWLGDETRNNHPTPIQIGTASDWVSVTAGYLFCVGLKNDGTLWGWGANNACQLGNDSRQNINTPVRIGTDNNWKGIAAGGAQNYGIKMDGTLWAWGNNFAGQLGISTTISEGGSYDRCKPLQVGSDSTWVKISAGAYHVVGLKADGTLWAWGQNNFGQVGNNTTLDQHKPVQIHKSTKKLF